MSVLNGFHPSIQFTYEAESHKNLLFLDVLIIRDGQSIETCVYRKSTDTDIDIHSNPVETQYFKSFSLSFIFDMFK